MIDQIAEDAYDPAQFQDEEKKRVLAAIDQKIAGKQIVASARAEEAGGGQVIDLMEALRASLGKKPGKPVGADDTTKASPAAARKAGKAGKATMAPTAEPIPIGALKDRKPVRRTAAAKVATASEALPPARTRALK